MLIRLLHYLLTHRKPLVWITTVFAAAALLFSIFADSKYETQTMLMPPLEEGKEGLLAAWMAQLNLPSMIAPMSAGRTTAEIMTDVLGSHRLGSMIVDSLDLRDWYGTGSRDEAIKELRGATGISTTDAGIIVLSVEDKSPQMAVTISKMYISSLDSLNRLLEYSRAGNTMRFISAQLDKYGEQLQESRSRIADFQKENGIVNFEEQTKGAIDVAVNLKLKQILAGINVELLKEYAKESTLDLKRKKAEYEKLTDKLEELASGSDSSSVFVPLRRLPELQQRYASLRRDLEVNEKIYSFLMERYEESGIEKARTTPSIQVIDYPHLPDKPVGIPSWLFVVAIALAGLVWGSIVIMAWGWVTMREMETREEKAYKELVEIVKDDLLKLRRFLRI